LLILVFTLREELEFRAFKNRRKKYLRLRKKEVRDGCRKLHGKKLHNFELPPCTARLIKSTKTILVVHVA
jgi:hypothetical protein